MEDEHHFTCKNVRLYVKIKDKYEDIHGPAPALSQLMDTSHIKTFCRYTLERVSYKMLIIIVKICGSHNTQSA